jgi:hypothetical protein
VSNYVSARVFNQKMNVVGRHHIIEHGQTEAFPRLENPMQVTATITCELQQKFPLVTPVSDMPDVAWQIVAVSAWHRFS